MKLPSVPANIAFALKALSAGNANEGQQKAALEWIMFTACQLRETSYPGDEKPMAMAFNEGRRFAGLLIAGALQAKPAAVKTKPKPTTREAKSDE